MNYTTSAKIQPPQWLRLFYGGAFWRGNSHERQIYLTFDDGPVPGPTEWTLKILADYHIPATFFCVGHNVEKHPEVFQSIVAADHSIGNHTYHHLQAFKTKSHAWFSNIEKGNSVMHTKLFRPPHGQLYPWHLKRLKKMFDQVVMWDVMPMDYDAAFTGEQVFEHVKQKVRPGSVLVFHDSHKAFERLRIALPLTIDYLLQQGYTFKKL